MKVKPIMNKAFSYLSIPLVFFLISCDVSEEVNEKPVPKQTELGIDNDIPIKAESISPSVSIKRLITSKGVENVIFGMKEAEIRAAYKGELTKNDDADNPECYSLYENSTGIISFMIYSGTLQRIDVFDSPDFITKEGVGNGMSFGAIEKIYQNAYRKPNFYSYPNEDLIVELDGNIKIIFEQSANEIVHNFRVGTLPSVDFVEGCL